ncbi:hypothetical protein UFOVP787_152 [uncultured Caudovirales phage]|uniref:Uncharacterized protein n=1 Tax=uncultured Caudovirales phage TaxID=2100421 RepID=A0A6J5NVP6_9CAUD|nr:hypothetical protein UFOVP787_152 [uncultured Caudovirales phage]
MAKTLRDIAAKDKFAGTNKTSKTEPSIDQSNLYPWNAPDGVKFIKKHKIDKKEYPYDVDDAFTSGKVKQTNMKGHGYKDPADDKIYESRMKCESCGKGYEGESCGCGRTVPEAKPGKGKGMIADKKKLQEVLTKKTPAGKVISDFVHSDDPKFAGKSKKERMRMALGAYYGMHPEKSKKTNEELETLDELSKSTLGSYIKKSSTSAMNAAYNAGTVTSKGTGGAKYLKKEKNRKEGIVRAVDKLTSEELAMPMLEGGKKKKGKISKESAPADTPITFPSGNVGDMPGRI